MASSTEGLSYYAILEVESDASQQEIRKAYLRQAAFTHPDKHPTDSNAKLRFQAVSEAYDHLKDETKRKAYDQKLVFEMSFGAFASTNGVGGAGTRSPPPSHQSRNPSSPPNRPFNNPFDIRPPHIPAFTSRPGPPPIPPNGFFTRRQFVFGYTGAGFAQERPSPIPTPGPGGLPPMPTSVPEFLAAASMRNTAVMNPLLQAQVQAQAQAMNQAAQAMGKAAQAMGQVAQAQAQAQAAHAQAFRAQMAMGQQGLPLPLPRQGMPPPPPPPLHSRPPKSRTSMPPHLQSFPPPLPFAGMPPPNPVLHMQNMILQQQRLATEHVRARAFMEGRMTREREMRRREEEAGDWARGERWDDDRSSEMSWDGESRRDEVGRGMETGREGRGFDAIELSSAFQNRSREKTRDAEESRDRGRQLKRSRKSGVDPWLSTQQSPPPASRHLSDEQRRIRERTRSMSPLSHGAAGKGGREYRAEEGTGVFRDPAAQTLMVREGERGESSANNPRAMEENGRRRERDSVLETSRRYEDEREDEGSAMLTERREGHRPTSKTRNGAENKQTPSIIYSSINRPLGTAERQPQAPVTPSAGRIDTNEVLDRLLDAMNITASEFMKLTREGQMEAFRKQGLGSGDTGTEDAKISGERISRLRGVGRIQVPRGMIPRKSSKRLEDNDIQDSQSNNRSFEKRLPTPPIEQTHNSSGLKLTTGEAHTRFHGNRERGGVYVAEQARPRVY